MYLHLLSFVRHDGRRAADRGLSILPEHKAVVDAVMSRSAFNRLKFVTINTVQDGVSGLAGLSP